MTPVRARRRRATEGLTAVETCVLISVCGVVLAVFVPTFLEHVRASKIAEASEQLEAIHRAAASYFAARHGAGTHCLPDHAGPTPERPTQDPKWVDFAAASPTWDALGSSPTEPTRYSYSFEPQRTGCGLRRDADHPLLTLRANGDLDGDGVFSTFERHDDVDEDGQLVAVDVLYVTDRVE